MGSPILSCSGLSVCYSGRAVASGIGFAVEAGEAICVVGENGSGKSTLLRTLLGLQPAIAGEITFGDGVRPGDIGYLPQQNPVQGDFPATALEIVRSGCQAMRACKSFAAVLLCAAATGTICAFLGIVASVVAGTPVGSTIVAADIAAFLLLSLAGRLRR